MVKLMDDHARGQNLGREINDGLKFYAGDAVYAPGIPGVQKTVDP